MRGFCQPDLRETVARVPRAYDCDDDSGKRSCIGNVQNSNVRCCNRKGRMWISQYIAVAGVSSRCERISSCAASLPTIIESHLVERDHSTASKQVSTFLIRTQMYQIAWKRNGAKRCTIVTEYLSPVLYLFSIYDIWLDTRGEAEVGGKKRASPGKRN